MARIRVNLNARRGPAYSGFWLPGTSGGSGYLTDHCVIRVRAGQYYWLTGFPENTLPSRCIGDTPLFSNVAIPTLLRKDKDGVWRDKDNQQYTNVDLWDTFAFAELNGKLHILYRSDIYLIRYRRASMTEINMYRSWS